MFDLLDVLKDVKTIGISGHVRPDGDCVGSTMAMYMYLTKNFPEKQVDIFLEPIPESYGCIARLNEVCTDFVTDVESYDAFIVIDCEYTRTGQAQPYFENAKLKINVDHHISNTGCGDINYIVPSASSACELVFDLLKEEKIDKEIALALYLGMIHDTGVFQYSNTSPKTLKTAAKLIEFEFDFSKIIEESFYQKTYMQNLLLGKAVNQSILILDGHGIYSVVSKEMMQEYNAKSSDLEGIVNQLRNTKDVDCAIFMYELEEGGYKISMRSNEKVNVSAIAKKFGGGGHVKAAGVTMDGTVEEIVSKLSELIEEQLKLLKA
ncbi:MAG: bifunctional oligoribonuclease/PAP phosphatase NrnA [Lachnospiraceae bacterium]|nr:bifunctional oligoribonuclease/PAP phosphatase NrnA [Lachnospiraceae bacterium]